MRHARRSVQSLLSPGVAQALHAQAGVRESEEREAQHCGRYRQGKVRS